MPLCVYADPSYVGCFLVNFVITPLYGVSPSRTTVETCRQAAGAGRFKYAAIYLDGICYGGNDITMLATQGVCNLRCAGDSSQLCGGTQSILVHYAAGMAKCRCCSAMWQWTDNWAEKLTVLRQEKPVVMVTLSVGPGEGGVPVKGFVYVCMLSRQCMC